MISKMINARRVSLNTSSAGYHCKDTAKEPVIKLVETPTSCCSSKARFAYKAKSQQFYVSQRDQTGPTGTKYLALTSTICNQPEILYSCSCSCELWIDVGQKDAFPNTTFARCTCPSMCADKKHLCATRYPHNLHHKFQPLKPKETTANSI